MASYITPITNENVDFLVEELVKNNQINPNDFTKFNVKRGLRNADGTGVMAGLTKISSVNGYYIDDGERVPMEGKLYFRGVNLQEIVANCKEENRFGFEEVAWLLIFGSLPTTQQLSRFSEILAECRTLPDDFIEDMIMKAPSPNIMNKITRSVLALYSYDENPDDASIENVIRQSIQIIAQIPVIMSYAYQVKRRHYYKKSMYIHPPKANQSTAESVLRSMRSDKNFTDEEAKLLDLCLMVHAEHGGGNNSTFATRVLTSSGTDTYAAIAAGIGALKGPKHGGANIKTSEMIHYIEEGVSDITDEGQIADFLTKIIRKEAGDRSGLVYGMGHAVYTLSDPRAVILKEEARRFAYKTGYEEKFELLNMIERLTPEIFLKVKGSKKPMCANVDLYSGLIYEMLQIPEDIYTPLFTTARIAGWSAHRLEELMTGGKIVRPAYKSVSTRRNYIKIDERVDEFTLDSDYVPFEERILK
ncbi:MAG: citrate/2-methylcitrate synthase [Clostridia bacterium]|nr:citrate/2-methylcitrate synthase [Clostridia bacterium]